MKKSVLFIGLTFLICWLIAGLYYFLVGTRGAISSIALGIFYMVVPMSVAIIIQKFVYREHIKNTLGISFRLNRWFIIAWLLPPLMMFATFGISLLLPSVEYRPNMEGMFERLGEILTSEQIKQMQKQATTLPISPIWFALFQGMIAGISVNANRLCVGYLVRPHGSSRSQLSPTPSYRCILDDYMVCFDFPYFQLYQNTL
jgi:hypothetical protein